MPGDSDRCLPMARRGRCLSKPGDSGPDGRLADGVEDKVQRGKIVESAEVTYRTGQTDCGGVPCVDDQ